MHIFFQFFREGLTDIFYQFALRDSSAESIFSESLFRAIPYPASPDVSPIINLIQFIMKTTEIPKQFFNPVDQAECTKINGGYIGRVFGAIAAAVLYEVVNDWDNFLAGLAGKPEIHYN